MKNRFLSNQFFIHLYRLVGRGEYNFLPFPFHNYLCNVNEINLQKEASFEALNGRTDLRLRFHVLCTASGFT
jgi:hypothetical protein